ncbi:MAG: YihY/virulence factor BrkB family protein [Anaerolineales bacterium]
MTALRGAPASLILSQLAHAGWRVVRATSEGLNRNEAGLRAAALAYQGLLSLFPLLLFLVFLASQVIALPDVRPTLDDYLNRALPTAAGIRFVKEIIDETLLNSRSLGLVGGLGLLWTSSALFSHLESSLNVIWNAPRRAVWSRRLRGLAGVLILGTLFIIAIALSALPALPFLDRSNSNLDILDLGVGFVAEVLLLWFIYRWLPNSPVRFVSALAGAVLAALLWEAAQFGFRVYLVSGLANFGAVYGTLASVIGLILWAYLTGIILFLGAEFSAALQREFWPPAGS